VEFVGVFLGFTILKSFLAFVGDILFVLLEINLNVLLVSLILHREELGIQITLELGLVNLDSVCSFLIAAFACLDVVNKFAQSGRLLCVRFTL
jgi:hypothetical protein